MKKIENNNKSKLTNISFAVHMRDALNKGTHFKKIKHVTPWPTMSSL